MDSGWVGAGSGCLACAGVGSGFALENGTKESPNPSNPDAVLEGTALVGGTPGKACGL